MFFQIHHNQSSSCALIVVDMCPDRFQLGEYQQAHADCCKANLELFMFFLEINDHSDIIHVFNATIVICVSVREFFDYCILYCQALWWAFINSNNWFMPQLIICIQYFNTQTVIFVFIKRKMLYPNFVFVTLAFFRSLFFLCRSFSSCIGGR